MRILVVDDDEVMRQVLSRWLRGRGHELRSAGSARAAQQLLAAYRPHLVVSALNLPDRTGLGFIREVRKRAPDTAILATGEDPSVRDLLDLLHMGVLDFIEQPVSEASLTDALGRLEAAHSLVTGRHVAIDLPSTALPEPAPARATPPAPSQAAPRSTLTRLLSTGLVKLVSEGKVDIPSIGPLSRQIQRAFALPWIGDNLVREVLGADRALYGAVLGMVGSQGERGSRLASAIKQMGPRQVLGLAQQVLIGRLFDFGSGELASMLDDAWSNLVVTAHGARALALDLGLPDPDGLFVTALFHNVGEVVLLRAISDRFEGSIGHTSRAQIGGPLLMQHEEIGKLVLAEWGLPPTLVRIAENHHLAPRARQPGGRVDPAQICMAAWTTAIDVGYDYVGVAGSVEPDPWLAAIGVDVGAARQLFRDAPKWIEQARMARSERPR